MLLVLNSQLLTKTYLVGERITLADIVVATSLLQAYETVLDPSARASYPNVNRWFTTLVNQPQFKAVLGEVHLCEKVGAPAPKAGGKAGAKKDNKKKETKKEPAKPKAPEPEEELDEADLLTQEKPSKDPFEAYPKG